MGTASYLKDRSLTRYVGVGTLKKFTDGLFPEDGNLAYWIWYILLRDPFFFAEKHPGENLHPRQYHLDILHAQTRETREEWLERTKDVDGLVDAMQWAIGITSLKYEYGKLYVHDENWFAHGGGVRCPDAHDHSRYRHQLPNDYAEIQIAHLTKSINRDEWEWQARVQNINPCVYSMLHWWLTVDPALNV